MASRIKGEWQKNASLCNTSIQPLPTPGITMPVLIITKGIKGWQSSFAENILCGHRCKEDLAAMRRIYLLTKKEH
jgi:hypothetical protein